MEYIPEVQFGIDRRFQARKSSCAAMIPRIGNDSGCLEQLIGKLTLNIHGRIIDGKQKRAEKKE